MNSKTAVVILVLSAILLSAFVCTPCLATTPEFRAFWVDAFHNGALSKSEVDKLLGVPGEAGSLGDIRNANCNAIFLEVRKNADAYYHSNYGEPWATNLSPAQFDSLQAVLDAAHDTTGGKKRIEVHAWLVTFRTSGGTVYTNHDDTPTGSLTTLDNYWPTRTDAAAEPSDKPFDPGHPLVEEYLTNVALDIANNYDVDGIHFDYIRFTGSTQGYNPTSIARYRARYGGSGNPSTTDPQFQQWRRDQILAYVRRVYAKLQTTKPNVLVSGSFYTGDPAPTAATHDAFKTSQAYKDCYSDWDSMMQEGIVDFSAPMTYFDLAGNYASDYTGWMNFEKDRKANRQAVVGPGIYLNYFADAISEMQMIRSVSPNGNYADGMCGFSYACPYAIDKAAPTYGTWANFAPTFVSSVCPTWADIPDRPWKSNPTKGHISGTVTVFTTGKWADGATVSITGPENRSMVCDGTGFYAFIDLTPGTYTVTSSFSGYPNAIKTVVVGIGQVTGNMYVTDFAMGATLPPAISNVAATNVTNNAATITWATDQGASSQVKYGLTSSYGSTTTLDSTYVTSHSVALSGLTPNTMYHFQVLSTGTNGPSSSVDYTFVTSGPPTITGVQSSVTATTATITWSTNTAADSKVNYGWTSSYGSQAYNASLVTSHSVQLTGLAPSSAYHYQCVSVNAYGTATSTDFTFTTNALPTISNVQSGSITGTTAVVTWTTDQSADSKANYGTTTSYGSQATNASLVTSHSISLSGLAPTTTYHFQCVSTNLNGTATSGDYTFVTGVAPPETVVDDTDPNVTYSGSAKFTISNPGAYPGGYNNNYRYCDNRRTSSTATVVWTPNLARTGPYDVYVWYTSGSNRSTAVKYTVNYSGGSTNQTINQTVDPTDPDGLKWVRIGTGLQFAAGTGGNVTMNNITGESSTTKVILVDAMKWVYVGADTAPPTVPQSLVVTPSSTTGMSISWAASIDDTAVTGYKIYRNGVQVGTSATTSYTDSGLTANTQYAYTVSAYDAVPNTSAQSTAVSKYTLSQPPTGSIITCNIAAGSWSPSSSFLLQNLGFGVGKVGSYKVAWDSSATHMWTGTEIAWTTTSKTCTADTTTQPYYFHAKGFNGDGVANGTLDLGPYNYGMAFDTIAAAMNNPDATGVIVSTYEPITAVFGNSFYVEEADRTRGLKIDATTALAIGKKAKIGGRLSGSSIQRSLVDAAVLDSSDGTALPPLVMQIAALGGASPDIHTTSLGSANGAYNIGLLVRLTGKVKSHATGSFVIDDGSGSVTVYSDRTVADGSFVGVSGICALESGLAVIRSRTIDDVIVYAP